MSLLDKSSKQRNEPLDIERFHEATKDFCLSDHIQSFSFRAQPPCQRRSSLRRHKISSLGLPGSWLGTKAATAVSSNTLMLASGDKGSRMACKRKNISLLACSQCAIVLQC